MVTIDNTALPDLSWLHQIVDEAGFGNAFAIADPHSPDFTESLHSLLDAAGLQLNRRICNGFSNLDTVAAYRNAASLAVGNGYLLSCISRAASHSGIDNPVYFQQSLSGSLLAAAKSDPGARWIFDNGYQGLPKLSLHAKFRPRLKLRYTLGAISRKRFNAARCITAVSSLRSCSRLAAQQELRRAIDAAESQAKKIVPLSRRQFVSLPLVMRYLITTDESLFQRMLSGKDKDVALKDSTSRQWVQRMAARKGIIQICKLLHQRSVCKANEIASSISIKVIDEQLKEEFGVLAMKRLDSPLKAPADEHWIPLSNNLNRVLSALTGNRLSGSTLSLTVEKILAKAETYPRFPRKIATSDLCRLKQSFTKRQLLRLARAGRFDLAENLRLRDVIPYLAELSKAAYHQAEANNFITQLIDKGVGIPEAVDLLANGKHYPIRSAISLSIQNGNRRWFRALLPLIGTKTAENILSPNMQTLKSAIRLAKSATVIANEEAFHAQLSSWLCELITFLSTEQWKNDAPLLHGSSLEEITINELLGISKQYQKANPNFIDILREYLGIDGVIALITHTHPNDRFIHALEKGFLSRSSSRLFLLTRLQQQGSPRKFIQEIKKDPDLAALLTPKLPKTLKLAGNAESKIFYILCTRRAPKMLQRYLAQFDWNHSKQLLTKAACLLKPTSRDRGYFELISALGPTQIRTVAVVLARISPFEAAGHKLDDEYRSYKLPKRSGGNRIISAPSPVLKRVQRAILHSILNPLGSHHTSYGFVAGRSIRDNAVRHVGQEVVVNCDVSNCFPSVSWSLVLGALRRDLSEDMSKAAISLLVDICTANGALPIGAPTSPCLLNRVLLRTDKILYRAASERNCQYTRYADDLTFSGDGHAVELLGIARRTIGQIGLTLDTGKTNIYRRGRRQIVTGLVVNDKVNVPRRIRRRLRAAMHNAELNKQPHWHGKPMEIESLRGQVSYLNSINEESAKKLIQRMKTLDNDLDK